MYRKKDNVRSELFLLKTTNGINYNLIVPLNIDGLASESTVTFSENDYMIIIVRLDDGNYSGKIAKCGYPYREWKWKDLGIRLGGPNIIPLRNDWYIIGTRSFNFRNQPKTSIYLWKEGHEIRNVVELPSGGDTGYPGLLIEKDKLWVSYYSSHQGKASVYIARIPLSWLNAEK